MMANYAGYRSKIHLSLLFKIPEPLLYRWRKQYGGMGTDQVKELKRLQKENDHLRRAVSDLTLEKLILKEAARGNF